MKPGKKSLAGLLQHSLLVAGGGTSIYLFNKHLLLAEGRNVQIDLCSALFAQGCDNALRHEWSTLLGMPLAGWGILFYASILLFRILPLLFGPAFLLPCARCIGILSALGFLAALFFLGLMAWQPALFCPLCTTIHGINILLFFLLRRQCWSKQVSTRMPGEVSSSASLRSNARVTGVASWTSLGFAGSLLFLGALFLSLQTMSRSAIAQNAMVDARPVLEAFLAEPVRTIPRLESSPRLGKSGDGIIVDVFSDFHCPACKVMAREIGAMSVVKEGHCTVVFHFFPLDRGCNRSVREDIHPLACEAAKAAIAAHQQGKFWLYHDALFNHNTQKDEGFLRSTAEVLGLDVPRFDANRRSAMAEILLQEDMAIAQSLGIHATPSVWVNGRPLRDLRPGILTFVVSQLSKSHTGALPRRDFDSASRR